MKHLKHLFTALLLLCATVATAHDFEVGGIYYNITWATDFTVEVTYRGSFYHEYSNEYSGNVVIPESVTYNGSTYSVTSIGKDAFSGCSSLTSVVIPNSVTSIGVRAFAKCVGLTSVEIPNSVTSIGYAAFCYCSGLTSVVIPNSVTSIGEYAFDETAWYNNQPDGVVYAGKVLYKYKGTMSSNTSIAIKDGTLGIGDGAFSGCSSLTSVVIPNSVTSIGERAFYNCSGLTSVEIPNSVTSIGDNAFGGTAWYNNQPDGVVYAGKVLYKYKGTMSSNTSIAIKDGTLGIGDGAFSGCSSLTSVVIPNSVTSIGEEAFRGCSGLTSVEIPNSVISIGDYAFSGCSALTSVVIGNGVTSIGEDAFSGCSSLTSVEIPNSVTSIGEFAFYECSALTSVVIGNGVTSIGEWAFSGCSSLTSVEIPNSVTSIGEYAFDECSGLTSVVIPNSVTSIGSYAFRNCSGLTSVVIPNSVTSIGRYAFSGCSGLKKVINFSSLKFSKGSTDYGYVAYYADTVINAPNGSFEGDFVFAVIDGVNTLCGYIGAGGDVTLPADYKGENYAIGADVFKNNTSLTSVVIPNSVTSIGSYAFYNCSGLTSVVIPNSVTSIGYAAFTYCSGLTSVVIGNGVTSIGSYAFYDCSGLTSVVIPNSVTSIGEDAFYKCSGLKKVLNFSSLKFSKGSTSYGSVAYYADIVINAPNGPVDGDFVFAVIDGVNTLCFYIGAGGDVTLPADYKGKNYAIGADVFKNNTSLTSIEIPNSVTSIGDGAFSGCSGLKEVHISDLSAWCNIAFASADANPLYYAHNLYLNGELVTDLVIPDGVTKIKGYAFYGCSGLTSVVIPNSVTSIGERAFRGCSGLKKVINFSSLTFSKGSTANGYVAYYADTVINVPNGSVEGDFVFAVIDGVNTLYGYIGAGGDVTLPADYKGKNYAIGADVFKNNTSLTSVVIPNSVTSIGERAFRDCSGLTSVVIGNGVTSIGYAAFSYCSGLTSVEIPNSVTSIGGYAFYECSGLTSVVIPNSVTSIGSYAFYNSSGLTSVVIPNSVTSIGDNAFRNCSGLKEVHISDLSAWCNIAFASADANPLYYAENLYLNDELLTELTIPDSVTEVKNFAFYNCTALTSIEILDGVTCIGEEAFRGCSDLGYIYISSTIESIGDYAFAECNNIFDIKIGSKKAVAASENVFSSDAYNNACLYVPAGCKDFYAKTSPWSNFVIQEIDFTGIDEVKGESGKVKDVYYDLNGRAVERPANGLYIKNGKKVFVK